MQRTSGTKSTCSETSSYKFKDGIMKKDFLKFKKIVGITLISALLLMGCGHKKEQPVPQGPDVEAVESEYSMDESQSMESIEGEYGELINASNTEGGESVNVTASTPSEFFRALIGCYKYEGCNVGSKEGFLVIEADQEAGGIAVGDYFDAEKHSYRFIGYDFYCEKMEGNRVYMEYPETVYDDDTADYSYYIFEVTNEGISVYFSYDSFDAAQLLYTAQKVN